MASMQEVERIFPVAKFPSHVMVDGEHFLAIPASDIPWVTFDEVVANESGEIALVEYKPRHGIWLRSKMTIKAA